MGRPSFAWQRLTSGHSAGTATSSSDLTLATDPLGTGPAALGSNIPSHFLLQIPVKRLIEEKYLLVLIQGVATPGAPSSSTSHGRVYSTSSGACSMETYTVYSRPGLHLLPNPLSTPLQAPRHRRPAEGLQSNGRHEEMLLLLYHVLTGPCHSPRCQQAGNCGQSGGH